MAHGDEPDAGDAARIRTADSLGTVRVDAAFFAEPPTEIGRPRADHEVGFASGPVREWTPVNGLRRENGAPLVSEVETVIELHRDAQVVVGGKRVLGDAGGQLVHFPLPRQHGFRCQRHTGLVADDGVLVVRGAGNRVPRL